METVDRCVMCDQPIPEGYGQVCHTCTKNTNDNYEVTRMNNNENLNNIINNQDPQDKVKMDVKGIYTRFFHTKEPRNSLHTCRILASAEEGIVSISMADEKKIMLTVRFDEMVSLITEALTKAKELMNAQGEKQDAEK